MEFRKYQHLERFGRSSVRGIEAGECYIFPKIDGTNSSVWLDDGGNIKAGSRNRELEPTKEKDNAGFYQQILQDNNIKQYLDKHPTHRLYGEFLVPHSLKTYRDDSWRKFYVFDVTVDTENEDVEYIPYNVYKPLLEEFNLNYIPLLAVVKNGSYEQFIHYLDKNGFLIKDGEGSGEGIVIKNYEYRNRYGKQIWAKIVANEFKEKHSKKMGSPVVSNDCIIEEKIVSEFCTEAFIEKEYAKIVHANDGFSGKNIPELLGRVWHEFIVEESWNIVSKHRNPTINYKILNNLVIKRIKEVERELFS